MKPISDPYIRIGSITVLTAKQSAVDLNFTLNAHKGFWEIKTAEPRRYSALKNKALIWEAAKHTSGGHGHRPN